MRITFFITILYLVLLRANAAEITISGKATGIKNTEIDALIIDDYISYKQKLIASSKVDQNGNFNLKASISFTTKLILRVNDLNTFFYVEPNKNYTVIIPPTDTFPSVGNTTFIPIKIENSEKSELNYRIAQFDEKYKQFIEKNYLHIVKKSLYKPLQEFKKQLNKEYSHEKNTFFKNYVFYAIGSLDLLANRKKINIYNEYFNNKQVLYYHSEYMNMFHQFYEEHLLRFTQSKKGKDAKQIINTGNDYRSLFSLLGKDSLLLFDNIRELVIIKGLQELYYNEEFNQKSILAFLNEIKNNSSFPEHQKIAANVIYNLTRFNKNNPAPDFAFPDETGKTISLKDLKGKFVFMQVYTSWCTSCMDQMQMFHSLQKKYGNKVEFVSISIDRDEKLFKKMLPKNYTWRILHCNNIRQFKDDYNINAVPLYFLIGTKGEILEAFTKSPDEGAEFIIATYLKGKASTKEQAVPGESEILKRK
jgi:thiol-disulfide isomerase/thioredoxin